MPKLPMPFNLNDLLTKPINTLPQAGPDPILNKDPNLPPPNSPWWFIEHERGLNKRPGRTGGGWGPPPTPGSQSGPNDFIMALLKMLLGSGIFQG